MKKIFCAVLAVMFALCVVSSCGKQKPKSIQETLFSMKVSDINDNDAITLLINELPFTHEMEYMGVSLRNNEKPYTVTLEYNITYPKGVVDNGKVNEKYTRPNAAILMCLIEDLEVVKFKINDIKEDGSKTTYSSSYTKDDLIYNSQDIKSYSTDYDKFFGLYELLKTEIYN